MTSSWQLVTFNTYYELFCCQIFSIMDPDRQKQEQQKPVQQQQRRSIVEGMARTGIIIIDIQF